MAKFSYKYLIFIVSFLILFAFFVIQQKDKNIEQTVPDQSPFVTINNIKIPILLADTPEKQTQGLSDRESLNPSTGMLFVFPKLMNLQFWMKNMHFPLDIVWIRNNKIIKIEKNLPPEGETPKNIYSSDSLANYVLELNAGFTDRFDISVGDIVEYHFKR